MCKLKKRGQVAIFIILGVILLFLFLGMLFYFSQGGFKPSTTPLVSFSEDVEAFKALRDSCLQKNFLEAKTLFGVDENTITQSKYEAYFKNEFPICMNKEIPKFSTATKIKVAVTDFSSAVKISPDAITVEANYPVTLTKAGQTEPLSEFSFSWKKERKLVVPIGPGGIAGEDIILKSPDQKIELRIPASTTVRTQSGQAVTSIEVEVVDRFFNDMANPLMLSSTAYGFSDLTFSSPGAILTVKYESSDIPPNTDETQLKISYYNPTLKVWVAWPSTVDTVKKTVTAYVTHLSNYSDIVCGNENNLPQIKDSMTGRHTECSKNQPSAYRPSPYSIPFVTQDFGSCLPESGDNIRIKWVCTDSCQNVQIVNTHLGEKGSNVDVPARAEFSAAATNRLSFDVVYKDTGNCCEPERDADGNIIGCAKTTWEAVWDFTVILFYGKGFYPSCIDTNSKQSFSVPSNGCVCVDKTIDPNSPVYSGGSVSCCADGSVACGGSCNLKNCEIGKNLTRADTGCLCGQYTHQPMLDAGKDLSYCCQTGSDCSIAPCNAIIGGKAVETCYCGGSSAASCTSAGMTCDKEHCCSTNTCWDAGTKKCTAAACTLPATCSDHIQNNGETGVDCGGPCPACGATAHCTNGVKDADETEVDCGGADCNACTPSHCTNGRKDADETDVDCGGADCNRCVPAHCNNDQQDADQGETDVDCGGADCLACGDGKDCSDNSDCISGYCHDYICRQRQYDRPEIIDIVIEK